MADQYEVRAEVSGIEQNPIWTNTTLVSVMYALKTINQCLYKSNGCVSSFVAYRDQDTKVCHSSNIFKP